MSDNETGSSARYAAQKVRRHLHWARTEGVGRLVEEDRLDPRERLSAWARRRRWRRVHAVAPGTAIPVFLVGVQRSGTNMLVRGLETDPAFEVHNENDTAAFDRFRLRGERVVGGIVNASRHRYVLFKPLCDSGRIVAVMDRLPVVAPALAVWAWRDVDDRARSAVSKFGGANLEALRAIAAGAADDSWQAVGLSDDSRALLAGFDYDAMSPHTASCLFWYVRNRMLFEQGLVDRPDFLVSSYDALVADPESATRALCAFLGMPWSPAVMAHVERRTPRDRDRLDIDPRVRERCDALTEQLTGVSDRQRDRLLSLDAR